MLALAAFASAQTYQITDLGPLSGAPTFATAISESGVISGYAQPDANSARAWVWRDGFGMTDLGSFGGADNRAFAVGMDGKVYGYAQNAGGVQRGFSWDNGVLTDIGSVVAGDAVNVSAANGPGVLAGTTTTGGAALGFTMTGGVMTLLPALAGAPLPATSAAYDINDTGRVVGAAGWIYGGTRAFRTDAGGALVSLGTLGANDSTATAINASGQVVGYSTATNNETHAFIFNDGTGMTDLGILPGGDDARAWGMNDAGDAVGTADIVATAQQRATLWPAGGAIKDLNNLIPLNSGWVLEEARDINNSGDIVGFGTIGGQQRAFLLEQFSGPDTFAPVAVAMVTLPTYGGTTSIPVAVSFWDNEKVVSATARAAGAVYLTGPNGFVGQGTVQSWTTNDSQRVNVTWIFPGPGGSWGPEDDGTYEVRVLPNQVSDLAMNKHPGGVIGTFVIGLQTTPTLSIAGLPATTTAGTPVSLTVSATSSYPSAVGDVFAFAVDWDGDGTNVQTVNAVTNTVIAHTFTSTGTRTVRVRATDPHGVQSSERTASISIANNTAAFQIATVLGTPAGVSSYATVAAVKAGTMYFFGTPTDLGTLATTWDYLTPGAGFVLRGDFDNGPIIPAGAGVDGRGRVVIFGGYEVGGVSTASGMTFALPNAFGGGVAAMPAATSTGPTTSDNLSRIYILANPTTLYRYTSGASGNGAWATLPGPGVALACISFDGGDRIVGFAGNAVWAYSISGNAWTQLGPAPIAPTRAALGADGLVYLVKGLEIWVFDPALNTIAKTGVTNYDESYSIVLKGTDGWLYLIGNGASIEKFDTRATTTQAPVITSAATGTTVVQGTAWTYTIAASGKPRPVFSLVHGPAGMTVNATTGVVAWTPALAQVGAQTAVVRATNSAGFAEQMITFSILAVAPDITAPTAPANPVVFNITTTSADLSWTAGTDNIGVTSYGIFERRVRAWRYGRTVYYAQVGTTTGTSWHTPTLPLCSSKIYYIAARDAAGNKSPYMVVGVTVLCTPTIGVTATGPGFPAGRWAIETEPFTSNTYSASGNPVPALTVASAPAGVVWHALSASSGYFTWTPAVGTAGDVTFSLTATSTAGSAAQSYPLHVYPQFTDLIPPSAAPNLIVDQVTGDSCRVTWGAATDNYGVTLYRVTAVHRQPRSRFHRGGYPQDQVVSVEVSGGTLQTLLNGLRPSTSFAVTVQARDAAGNWGYVSSAQITTLPQPFVLADAQVHTTANANGSTTMTWPGYGYYWKYTVQCTTDLVTWLPVEPASQWPSYVTTFTFTPDPGVPSRFYRVLATPAY